MNRKPLVLLIDDDQSTLDIIKNTLKNGGFSTLEAEDGRFALEVFEMHQPDMVILDMCMPQSNGAKVCRQIRAHPDGGIVPVVILTDVNDVKAIREAFDAGATDFFTKPFNHRILSERIRYMIRAGSAARRSHQTQVLLERNQSIARLGGFFWAPDASNIQASGAFQTIFDFPKTDQNISLEDFWTKIHPDDHETLADLFKEARTSGEPFQIDIRSSNGNQNPRFAMFRVNPQKDSNGNLIGLAGTVQDITERKLSELIEIDQNRIMQHIVKKEPLKKIFLEATGLLERQSPQSTAAICRVEGEKIQEMFSPGLPLQLRRSMSYIPISPDNGSCAAAAYLGQPVFADDIAISPFWKIRKKEFLDHGFRSSTSVPIFSGTGQVLGTIGMIRRDGYRATAMDITLMERVSNLVSMAMEQEHLSRQLIYQARHDPLTGLINRATLTHWLAQTLRQAARKGSTGAYLFIDLDRFKLINDSLGHHVGDLLLKELAGRLRECVRESDLLARIGGDEFVLVMSEIKGEEDGIRAASRILESFNSTFLIEGHSFSIEASIGITLFPRDAMEETVLHRNADIAMYVAKNQGGNRFQLFDSKMHESAILRLQIENDLRKAMERNEFEIYYQPQFDLGSKNLVGMEALIRWNHPERGRIPPSRFIPTAEETRLIIPIGKWVLKEACRQNMAWQKQGFPPFRMAVNVSAIEFSETDIKTTIQEVLSETGLDPLWLEIEITESAILNNMDKACETLQRIKSLGVTIMLDDFGTGYSSITYLNHMALDGIKIDQSYIRNLGIYPVANERSKTSFVKTFATLAQGFQLRLVAEGIETDLQCSLLSDLGYTSGQGFFFSAPVQASEAFLFLKNISEAHHNQSRGCLSKEGQLPRLRESSLK